MWSSGAFFGVPVPVPGAVEGFGLTGVARGGVGVGDLPVVGTGGEAVAVGVAVWVGAAVTVGVGVGDDLATGVRWLHAPSAMSRMAMPLQAVTRRRSAMQ
jgi:hypothetical protein